MIGAGLYFLAGIVNLTSAFLFKDKVRIASKICLMPTLLLAYLLGSAPTNLLVVAAIVFSWVGDALLVKKDKRIFFMTGLAAFLIAHLWYIAAFMSLARGLNLAGLIVSGVIAIPLGLVILRLVDAKAPMKIPVTAYAVVIILMSLAALQLLLMRPGPAATAVFVGALVYIVSDSLMAYLLFHRQPKYFNVITMVPYIVAQGCIVLGLAAGPWS